MSQRDQRPRHRQALPKASRAQAVRLSTGRLRQCTSKSGKPKRVLSSACCLEVLVARRLARRRARHRFAAQRQLHTRRVMALTLSMARVAWRSLDDRTAASGPPGRDRLVPLGTGVSGGRAFTVGPGGMQLWCVAHSSSRLDGARPASGYRSSRWLMVDWHGRVVRSWPNVGWGARVGRSPVTTPD
ncbi:hypothetical protein BT67DRAFT_217405 [Trichocladium antarcticum]|uniref:Uncharacterized protein n=1 Tax=Trichocladium antarcticum TaxID=1450529 RepID=A0AAN6UD96_9PEZI|nr:hypothetical protein BT67DRAFT_217405 [Trichocladium antarcticum]